MDNETKTITVKELNDYVKNKLENDQLIRNLWIKGEISNLKHAMSGHWYFTLKDDEGSISVALFKTYANNLEIKLKDGQEVLIKGKVSIYQKTGSYQLYAQYVEEVGLGNIYMQIEKLKQKLLKEGIFDKVHKKQLPERVDRIGIVTSSKGAVVHDIRKVVSKRNPFVDLIIYPVTVQGETAAEEICRGIEVFNSYGQVDVIIVGRGGGSLEDLMAFNDEKVIRSVFKSQIPVISAVGHETDTTLCDYVADYRGATPSQAAEIATISLSDRFSWQRKRLTADYWKIARKVNEYYQSLDLKMDRFKYFSKKKDILNDRLADIHRNMQRNFKGLFEKNGAKLLLLGEKLHLLSPLGLLTKGYSITTDKDKFVIKDINQAEVGDKVSIRLMNGSLYCLVEGKEFIDGKQ